MTAQLKIREMPKDDRPRERLAARGASALTDAELIAILLRTGVEGANAVEVARQLIEEYGSLGRLGRCSVKELAKIKGVGSAKAAQLAAAFGLGRRLAEQNFAGRRIEKPEQVYELLGPELQALHKESLRVILLDTRYNRSPVPFEQDPKDPTDGGRYVANTDPSSTILGAAQWVWLEEQLRQPAQIRIIGSSIQVVNEGSGGEKWSNFPHEKKKLFEMLWANRNTGVIFISGDRHYAELDMMDGEIGYPVYDLTSSSLNWAEPRWRRIAPSKHRIGLVDRGDNFGLIEIDWERTDPLIRLKIVDVEGDTVLHKKIDLSTLREGNLEWWLGEK
jgi:hypothetical protein